MTSRISVWLSRTGLMPRVVAVASGVTHSVLVEPLSAISIMFAL